MLTRMHMSDDPSVTIETTITAQPDRIYELVSDLDVMSSFGTEFQSGEWSSGRPAEKGSTFLGRQKMGDDEWETTSTVVTANKGRAFAWRVGDPADDAFTAEWTLNLRSVPNGTELRYTFQHGPGPSGLRAAIENKPEDEEAMIDFRLTMLQENMVKTLEGIRRRTAR